MSPDVGALIRALEKLPPYRGVSYRGHAADATFGRSVAGQRRGDEAAHGATSRDVRVATENFTANGLNVFVGRTGRAIERLSQKPEEKEVVFLPVSMFMVVERFQIDELPVMFVEQLNPELGKPDDALATLEEIATLVRARVAEARGGEPIVVRSPGKFTGDVE